MKPLTHKDQLCFRCVLPDCDQMQTMCLVKVEKRQKERRQKEAKRSLAIPTMADQRFLAMGAQQRIER